jgi:membrane protein DedA with SNARE-associated domain
VAWTCARVAICSFNIDFLTANAPLLGVLAALLLGGLGFPIPEDLALLGAGYLVWHGDAPLVVVAPLAFLGIIAGDFSLYWIGRAFGVRITQHRFLSHALTPPRLARVRGYFDRHGAKTLLVARLAAGARSFFFLTAGAMRMPFGRFALFDMIGAAAAATIWIYVGWRFGANIHRVRAVIHRVEHIAALVLLAVIAAWIVSALLRRRLTGPVAPAAPETETSAETS